MNDWKYDRILLSKITDLAIEYLGSARLSYMTCSGTFWRTPISNFLDGKPLQEADYHN